MGLRFGRCRIARAGPAHGGPDRAAVDPDALTARATSKHVTRYRCKACASPVLAHLGKDAAAAPLALAAMLGGKAGPKAEGNAAGALLDYSEDGLLVLEAFLAQFVHYRLDFVLDQLENAWLHLS